MKEYSYNELIQKFRNHLDYECDIWPEICGHEIRPSVALEKCNPNDFALECDNWINKNFDSRSYEGSTTYYQEDDI